MYFQQHNRSLFYFIIVEAFSNDEGLLEFPYLTDSLEFDSFE